MVESMGFLCLEFGKVDLDHCYRARLTALGSSK